MSDDKELNARLRDFEKVTVGDAREAAARIEALTKERDEAWESITNNNDWFGCCMSVWSWLMSQPDMPDIDLKEGGADECVFNYKTAINALIAARATLAEIKGESHD